MLQVDRMNGDLLKPRQRLRRLHKSYFDLFIGVRRCCPLLVPCFITRTSVLPEPRWQGNFFVPPMWEQGKMKVRVTYLHAQEQCDMVLSPARCKVFHGRRPNKWIENLQKGTRGPQVVLLLVSIRKNSSEFSVGFREAFRYILSHFQDGIKLHRPHTLETFTVHAPSPFGSLKFSTRVPTTHSPG